MGLREEKGRIRAELSAIRIRPEERERASSLICDRIRSLEVWKDAKTVLLFAPLPDEPDILELVDCSKIICFPRYKSDRAYESAVINDLMDLVTGKFGIREPSVECPNTKAGDIDLTVIPGVAFDRYCNRLGRGRGFYDRWLLQLAGWKIGVGYDHQLVHAIPTEPHDVQLDMVAAPSHMVD
tara:strand:- start:21 stop:566 length:546 start_codon:yes stop_codon:yes gene_type:complete